MTWYTANPCGQCGRSVNTECGVCTHCHPIVYVLLHLLYFMLHAGLWGWVIHEYVVVLVAVGVIGMLVEEVTDEWKWEKA